MKILYIMSSYNIYGGTPKKTLDFINNTKNNSYLYVYYENHLECREYFEENTTKIYEGYYGKNLYKHIYSLIKIIDENNIEIIQTQFLLGELLGGILKVIRPKVKIIVAFVGSSSPEGIKKIILNFVYKKIDAFIFISEYVKQEKIKKFSILKNKRNKIIYNGTIKRFPLNTSTVPLLSVSLIDVAALLEIKNAMVLVEALDFLVNEQERGNIYLYLIGEGSYRTVLEKRIKDKNLGNNIFLLGKQKDIGGLLEQCNIFVHPCYVEGFGISVVEAMMAEKPIIVSNAGAHPELIKNNESGLLVDPFDAKEWANAIVKLIDDNNFSQKLAKNAKLQAETSFSITNFVTNYEEFYIQLLEEK